ncbi:MAG: outer membrane beta-barrel protein [FCB group bacterium]|nr:outer membrane beta-barrel protein [FCB group bacterium]
MTHQQRIVVAGLMIIAANVSFSQESGWTVALKSSYFQNQSAVTPRITSVKRPFSIGVQLRYNVLHDFAVQYSIESLNGKRKGNDGDELSIHNSLSALIYPANRRKISPYFISGVKWIQLNRNVDEQSKNEFSFQMGFGYDIPIIDKLVSNVEVKMYSDGFNYLGWSSSFHLGFR